MNGFSLVNARYYYGNGDFYDLEGGVGRNVGGGKFPGGNFEKGQVLEIGLNETGYVGYYKILESSNFPETNMDQVGVPELEITRYFDHESGKYLKVSEGWKTMEGFGTEMGYLGGKWDATTTPRNELFNWFWEYDHAGQSPSPQDPAPMPSPSPSYIPSDATSLGVAPKLLKATLRSNQIVLQFDDAISDTLPRVSNFTLMNGNREVGFIDAEVIASAGQLVLTTDKPLDPSVSVSLDYFDLASDQSNGVIQSQAGVDLASFTGFKINNQTTQANTLAIEDADFEGNTITLNLNAPISASIPTARRFRVKSGRKGLKVLRVDTDASEGVVTLTTKKYIGNKESIRVSYRDLRGDQISGVIEDKSGNDMVSVRNYEITNSSYEDIPPKLVGAELDDNILTLEFDSIINNTRLSKNRFKVKANGKRLRVVRASVENNDESFVSLFVKSKRLKPIDLQSEVTLSYRDPKGDQLRNVVEDVFGNDLPSIKNFVVDIV